ncbi:MAG: hypothetical protein Salg2KO_22270 [Salibacteraceae bacterium]
MCTLEIPNNMKLSERICNKFLSGSLALMVCIGCQSSDKDSQKTATPVEQQELLQGKFVHLSWLTNQEESDFDAIVLHNEEIRRDIESIHTLERFEALAQAIKQGSKNCQGLVSPDGRLVIMSWKTGLDRLGYDVKSMALFKYDGKIKVSSLYGNPKIFERIEQIKGTKGRANYILKESGMEGSTSDNYAYRISDCYLDLVPLDGTFVAQR